LSDSVPARVFIPGWFGVRSDDIVIGEDKIIISDFGESFNPQKTARFSSKTLPLLQPPEARFSDEPLSFASDIWTLACTIWEIFDQRPLRLFGQLQTVSPRSKSKFSASYLLSGGKSGVKDWSGSTKRAS
jgi:serine/threonine protein kinase